MVRDQGVGGSNPLSPPVRAYHTILSVTTPTNLDWIGPVRVKGTVDYEAEGDPALVSVPEVERLQTELPLPEPERK